MLFISRQSWYGMIMKPVATIVILRWASVSFVDLPRRIFQVSVFANAIQVPLWLSILGRIAPAVRTFMMRRKNEE